MSTQKCLTDKHEQSKKFGYHYLHEMKPQIHKQQL